MDVVVSAAPNYFCINRSLVCPAAYSLFPSTPHPPQVVVVLAVVFLAVVIVETVAVEDVVRVDVECDAHFIFVLTRYQVVVVVVEALAVVEMQTKMLGIPLPSSVVL